MTKSIGGDQGVRLNHDWQEADEGQAERQHGGEDGD